MGNSWSQRVSTIHTDYNWIRNFEVKAAWERCDGIFFLLEKITSRCEKTIYSVIDAKKNSRSHLITHKQIYLKQQTTILQWNFNKHAKQTAYFFWSHILIHNELTCSKRSNLSQNHQSRKKNNLLTFIISY